MSQAKVDKYKEYKKNRKKKIAAEKRRKKAISVAITGIFIIAALALVLIVGFMIHGRIQKTIPKYDYVAEEFILNDLAGVMITEPATETPTEGTEPVTE
ncbi:MAG: hypothetical protein J6T47_00315 [Lachnospiraceae bacterium]|nr:hypothetical protein [Lachnospiraceae bacterium]